MDKEQSKEQLEKDIAALKKMQGLRFIILYTLSVLLLGFFLEWLFYWVIDKVSLHYFIASYRWTKLVWMAVWWLAFGYFFIVKQNQKQLRKKQEELKQIRNNG
jgi:hypothetical protein